MPEKTKQQEEQTSAGKCEAENKPEADKIGTWSEDQKEKGYYYDDSYGYELYDPDEEDETD